MKITQDRLLSTINTNAKNLNTADISQQNPDDLFNTTCSFIPSLDGLGSGNLAAAGFQLTNGIGQAGGSSAIGDVNGDGIGDMLIGAPYANNKNGTVYLVLGSSNPNSSILSSAIIYNGSGEEGAGQSVAIGDVNNDGYGDMLIGASGANGNVGAAYLVLGSSNPSSSALTSSITYNGTESGAELAGISIAIGDVNGDSYADMLIGANFANNQNGTAYLVLGSSNPVSSDLSDAITFSGSGKENAGRAVAIGDVNGDGYGDMLIGAYANNQNGTAYLVLGGSNLSNITLSNAIAYSGSGGEEAGISVAIGDVNGDSFGDMLIGAYTANNYNGAAYLVLGSSNPVSSDLSNSVAFSGSGGEEAGISVAIGDVNGDGYGDILLGAYTANDYNGAAYLVLGSSNPVSSDLSSAVVFSGSGGEVAGASVAIGDVNGDGLGDVLIGAPLANQSYIVLGNKAPWLSSNINSSTYAADMPYLILNPSLQLHESEAQIISATIQINDNFQAAEDNLKVMGLSPNITALPFNTTTGTLSLTGSATAAEYQEALERVAYVNAVENPNTLPRTISFQVDDGRLCGISNQFNQAVNILPATPSIPCASFDNLAGLGSGTLAQAGFQLINGTGWAGQSVAIGDVNGDGYGDMLVGAYANNQAYLVLGSANSQNVNLSTNAIQLSGIGNAGWSVAIGNVNGDNYDDMLIGAPYASQAYLVLGSSNLTSIDLSTTIQLYDDGTMAGWSVAIGDVTGDGLGDMLIGTHEAGLAYLVKGSANFSSNSKINLANEIVLNNGGEPADWSVAIGDVNGDGYGDMLIGAPGANNDAGVGYLVLGNASFNGTNLNTQSIHLYGGSNSKAGSSVAIGDVNGDGYGDMLLGAIYDEAAYLVLGSENPVNVNLTTNGIKLYNGGAYTGISVAVGDVNGDGLGDILIGASLSEQIYLVLGSKSPSDVNLETNSAIILDGGNGNVGASLAIGDVNGDGLGDMLLGAPLANQTYIVLGNKSPWLSSNRNSTTYVEDMPYLLLNPSLQLHESDAQIISATIQITENHQAEDNLKIINLPSSIIAQSFNTTTGTLTLTGAATATEYQEVLKQVAYINTAENPNTQPRTISFQVNDGRLCGISNQFNQAVNILPATPSIPCSSFDNLNGLGTGALTAAGFQLTNGTGEAGVWLAVGDVNGDGYGDMLLGAPNANQAYLVLGSANPSSINLETDSIILSGGSGEAGVSVAMGDVNGDGYDDMLIGDYHTNQIYLVLGSKEPSSINLNTSAVILSTNGPVGAGVMEAIGDVNGDGYGDMLLGTTDNQAFLVLGSSKPTNIDLEETSILLSGGIGNTGQTLAVGDVNGDGYDDMLLGSFQANQVYLVLGSAHPVPVDLSTGDAILLSGGSGNAGLSVAIGDVNGDNYGDILIGAPGAGQVYLVLGSENPSSLNLSTNAILLSGGSGGPGHFVAIGDVNGDGYGDMLLGAPNANQAYLVLGSANPSSINLETDSIILSGGSGDAGVSVAIGDINGDGLGDMLLGAFMANQTYALYGNRTPWLSSNTNNATYIENSSSVLLNPDLQLHENEAQIVGATVQITEGYQLSEDTLNAAQLPMGITSSFNSTSGTLTLTGTASAADYQTALTNIAYSNAATDPNNAARTVTFQVDDGRLCGKSNTFQQRLNVNVPSSTAGSALGWILGCSIGLSFLAIVLGFYLYKRQQNRNHRLGFFETPRVHEEEIERFDETSSILQQASSNDTHTNRRCTLM